MGESLKPCPFCGSHNLRSEGLVNDVRRVSCQDCFSIGPAENAANVSATWQDRVSSSKLQQALADALRENATLKLDAQTVAGEQVEAYDPGLLNGFGGGDVEWWHNYIRSLLVRADHYYRAALGEGDG